MYTSRKSVIFKYIASVGKHERFSRHNVRKMMSVLNCFKMTKRGKDCVVECRFMFLYEFDRRRQSLFKLSLPAFRYVQKTTQRACMSEWIHAS
jgi:hypothetical protein